MNIIDLWNELFGRSFLWFETLVEVGEIVHRDFVNQKNSH